MIKFSGPIQCGATILILQSPLLPDVQRNTANVLVRHSKVCKVLIRELAGDLVDELIWQCEKGGGLH